MEGSLLWMFVLIGNAAALVGLNLMFSGGTSAMSDRVTSIHDVNAMPHENIGLHTRAQLGKQLDDRHARANYKQGLNDLSHPYRS